MNAYKVRNAMFLPKDAYNSERSRGATFELDGIEFTSTVPTNAAEAQSINNAVDAFVVEVQKLP